jgi:hypothetical protein
LQTASPDDELSPRSRAGELLFGAVLFAGCVAVLWHGLELAIHKSSWFSVSEVIGLGVMMLGACFDPLNCLAFCMPWVVGRIWNSPPLRNVGLVIIGVGWVMLIVGVIGTHWLH